MLAWLAFVSFDYSHLSSPIIQLESRLNQEGHAVSSVLRLSPLMQAIPLSETVEITDKASSQFDDAGALQIITLTHSMFGRFETKDRFETTSGF